MELHQLPPFSLERWFTEFEFVPGMRNLAASGPFAVKTGELLELEGAETKARYLDLDLDYIENPGSESLRQGVADLHTRLEAGYTAFVQMPANISTAAFCRRLAQEQHILLLPGEVYGSAYKHFVRFGFGCDPGLFQEGLITLLKALSVY